MRFSISKEGTPPDQDSAVATTQPPVPEPSKQPDSPVEPSGQSDSPTEAVIPEGTTGNDDTNTKPIPGKMEDVINNITSTGIEEELANNASEKKATTEALINNHYLSMRVGELWDNIESQLKNPYNIDKQSSEHFMNDVTLFTGKKITVENNQTPYDMLVATAEGIMDYVNQTKDKIIEFIKRIISRIKEFYEINKFKFMSNKKELIKLKERLKNIPDKTFTEDDFSSAFNRMVINRCWSFMVGYQEPNPFDALVKHINNLSKYADLANSHHGVLKAVLEDYDELVRTGKAKYRATERLDTDILITLFSTTFKISPLNQNNVKNIAELIDSANEFIFRYTNDQKPNILNIKSKNPKLNMDNINDLTKLLRNPRAAFISLTALPLEVVLMNNGTLNGMVFIGQGSEYGNKTDLTEKSYNAFHITIKMSTITPNDTVTNDISIDKANAIELVDKLIKYTDEISGRYISSVSRSNDEILAQINKLMDYKDIKESGLTERGVIPLIQTVSGHVINMSDDLPKEVLRLNKLIPSILNRFADYAEGKITSKTDNVSSDSDHRSNHPAIEYKQ